MDNDIKFIVSDASYHCEMAAKRIDEMIKRQKEFVLGEEPFDLEMKHIFDGFYVGGISGEADFVEFLRHMSISFKRIKERIDLNGES